MLYKEFKWPKINIYAHQSRVGKQKHTGAYMHLQVGRDIHVHSGHLGPTLLFPAVRKHYM